jgi:hypothetical protein
MLKFLSGSLPLWMLEQTSGPPNSLAKLTWEGLLDVCNKRYNFQGKCFPTSQAVTLPKAQVTFNMIYFNFLEQMDSLLMDNILMQSDNLLFHNDNQFSPPPKQDPPVLHNINDGSLYRMGRTHLWIFFVD